MLMDTAQSDNVHSGRVPAMLQPNRFLDELVAEHRDWLSDHDDQYLKNFDKLINADYEAAMTEASVRRMLQGHGAHSLSLSRKRLL